MVVRASHLATLAIEHHQRRGAPSAASARLAEAVRRERRGLDRRGHGGMRLTTAPRRCGRLGPPRCRPCTTRPRPPAPAVAPATGGMAAPAPPAVALAEAETAAVSAARAALRARRPLPAL